MKTKLFISAILIALCVISLAGCFSVAAAEVSYNNKGVFGEQVITPAKDFVSKGLVFTETVFYIDSTKGTIDGALFTYQDLLKEAKKVGGDAIINVVIDKKRETSKEGKGFTEKTRIQETWYGSALAIQYTNSLKTGTTTTLENNKTVTTEGWITNRPAAPASGGGSASTETAPSSGGGLFGLFR